MDRVRAIAQRMLALLFTLLTLGLVEVSPDTRRASTRDDTPIVDIERDADV